MLLCVKAKTIVLIVFTAILEILSLSGCGQRNSAVGPAKGVLPEVSVVTMQEKRFVVTTELSGRTSANLVAELRPQVSGLIQKRLFVEGADVKAGQILYQIEPATYRAALENATANQSAMEKNTERARSILQVSIAAVKRQQATLSLAQINRERFEEVFKEGAVSAGQRDQAVTEAKQAEAVYQAAEAQVESDRKAVAAAEAAIQQARAAVKTARINLGFTEITAPISGRIGRSNVTVGALVTAHQPLALATIQKLDPIYVDVQQSTTELLRLRRRLEEGRLQQNGQLRQKVRLMLEDGMQYPFDGKLQFRDVTVDPTTGSVILRVVFPNPQRLLLPGMFVRAVVEEGVNERAIMIPQQAILRNPKGDPFTLLVNTEGKVEQRMLTLDRAVGDAWLVAAGLKAGERVIVEGIQKVKPGAAVKVVAFDGGGEKSDTGLNQAAPPAAKKN